ncbi:hypothetical protein PSTT_15558 [Puccinia striiformis]|uniref:Semialdehyde dehydrogenase dimerisation domain-containing protein n=1 Tax=Puccinia striiformis TaxID=27350 RepID=A0A2S4UH60_9BASI|nr:hypothetical protein PSTT_15558 [Puccinia striiformis]
MWVICDLPAVRKVMGLAGHSSSNHLCSFCKIHKENIDSIDSTTMLLFENSDDSEGSDAESDLDFCAEGIDSSSDTDLDNHASDFEDCLEEPDPINQHTIFSNSDNMEILRSVIKTIHLPSWINRVPVTIGEVSGGKLKADEWIVLFTIMLVPVMGIMYHTEADVNVEILHNFFELVSAMTIVRQSEIQKSDIVTLREYLQKYRRSATKIFPQFKAVPNHHLLLHIPECMARFGPASTWTGWVFERLNGNLRNIPTNNQMPAAPTFTLGITSTGTLDSTLLRKYVAAANLKAALPGLCKNLPPSLNNSLLDHLRSNQSSGSTMLDDPERFEVTWLRNKLVKLSQETVMRLVRHLSKTIELEIVCSRIAPGWGHLLKLFKSRNATYSIHDWHVGNSVVEYTILEENDVTKRCCGRICNIFTMRYCLGSGNPSITEMWVEVERFENLDEFDSAKHPYSGWPHIKATVVYSPMLSEPNKLPGDVKIDLIKPDKISGHMACLEAPAQAFELTCQGKIFLGKLAEEECFLANRSTPLHHLAQITSSDRLRRAKEEKIERECLKILGTLDNSSNPTSIRPHVDRHSEDATGPMKISATTTRVPVLDGHTATLSISFKNQPPPSPEDYVKALRAYRSEPQILNCPSAPNQCIFVHDEEDRPQPRLDHYFQDGAGVSVGRVRECQVLDIKFIVLSNNVSIGAATSSIMNAELAVAKNVV